MYKYILGFSFMVIVTVAMAMFALHQLSVGSI